MLPVSVPPRVKAGVVVPQNGVPVADESKKEEIEVVERPVPPPVTPITPTSDDVEILVKPDPLPFGVR